MTLLFLFLVRSVRALNKQIVILSQCFLILAHEVVEIPLITSFQVSVLYFFCIFQFLQNEREKIQMYIL